MEKMKMHDLFIIYILAACFAVMVINNCDAQGKYIAFRIILLLYNLN